MSKIFLTLNWRFSYLEVLMFYSCYSGYELDSKIKCKFLYFSNQCLLSLNTKYWIKLYTSAFATLYLTLVSQIRNSLLIDAIILLVMIWKPLIDVKCRVVFKCKVVTLLHWFISQGLMEEWILIVTFNKTSIYKVYKLSCCCFSFLLKNKFF